MNNTKMNGNINTTILIAIIVAIIGIITNAVVVYCQGYQNRQLEVLRLESSLILSAVSGVDQDTAKDNLRFLSETGLINKTKSSIKIILDVPNDEMPFSFKSSIGLEHFDRIFDESYSPIEKKYINIMRYFNNEIDDLTANEIYWAIASLHGEIPNVDARLVMAIFAVESNFKERAESPNGAKGLGQLTPEICKEFNIKDPFNASENTRGTFMFLDKEFEKWKNEKYPLDLVVAAKFAGSNAVEKYHDIPPDLETQDYVRKVIIIYNQLIPIDEEEKLLQGKTRFFIKEPASQESIADS